MDLVKQQEEVVDKLQGIALGLLGDDPKVAQAALVVEAASTATERLATMKALFDL